MRRRLLPGFRVLLAASACVQDISHMSGIASKTLDSAFVLKASESLRMSGVCTCPSLYHCIVPHKAATLIMVQNTHTEEDATQGRQWWSYARVACPYVHILTPETYAGAVCYLSAGAGADAAGGVPHGNLPRHLGLLGPDRAQGGLVLLLPRPHPLPGEAPLAPSDPPWSACFQALDRVISCWSHIMCPRPYRCFYGGLVPLLWSF